MVDRVPFLDLGEAYREVQAELDAAVSRVLASGWYILGPEVAAFEEEFAAYCGATSCIGVGNGLDALTLALRAMDVGPGDEVIVPSNTYIATWLAVSHCGAIAVPVEPLEATFNLDPARVESAITPRTKVVLPVHLYGQPVDLDAILAVSKKHGLRVLEDAAQAHGALYKGRRIGSHGNAVAWSFYPSKNLGAIGDGGAVTTSDPDIDARIRSLRNYGSKNKYVNDVLGYNSRLDPIQAAVLRVKLKHLDAWNVRRRIIAAEYQEGLAGCGLVLPQSPHWAVPVWHLYVIRSSRRDRLKSRLEKSGIDAAIHYPIPPHRQHAYASAHLEPEACRLAARLADEVLSLPIGPHLTSGQVSRVVSSIREALLE
jgi:dTDP-4-amino-4,6-dideoxygalactose transaminase